MSSSGATFVAHLCQLIHHFQLFLRGVFGISQSAFDTGVAQIVLGGLQVAREGKYALCRMSWKRRADRLIIRLFFITISLTKAVSKYRLFYGYR